MRHIILDLEFSQVVDKEIRAKLVHTNKEIIQIGAVMLDEQMECVSEFECYVKPMHGPVHPKCTKLTGITTEDVMDAKNLEESLKEFVQWIGNEWNSSYIYAWSAADYLQLHGEMKEKNIHIEEMDILFENWIDFQMGFEKLLGYSWQLSLKHAVSAMDLEFEGKQHTALADAKNTAKLFALTKNEKEFKRRSEAIRSVFGPKEELNSGGDIFWKAFQNAK